MNSQSKRVLIVDDAPDIQFLLKELLESEGYAVEHAENGREALQHLKNCASLPDLILLDLMMPIMDGYEFRKAQQQDARIANLPTIIMSADTESVRKKQRITGNAYITKPMDIDVLLSLIREQCTGLTSS